MVGRQEKVLNSRRSRMVKTVTFWTLVSLLIVSVLKLSFFFCFFFLCYVKKLEGRGEEGVMDPSPPVLPALSQNNREMQATDLNLEFRTNLQFTEKTIS